MIIKLATFASEVELEKEAGARTPGAIWAMLPKPAQAALKAAGLDAKDLASHVGSHSAKVGTDAARAAGVAGNYATGTNLTGALGRAVAHIKDNKAAYGGGALLAGGGLAYRQSRKK
jgi:hypothetical protein